MGRPRFQSAYGMNIRGLPRLVELASGDRSSADPEVTVLSESDDRRRPDLYPIDHRRSVRLLSDGRVLALDRDRATATFFGPPLSPDLLAHPYLAPVATTFSRWAGREAYHAGAFVAADRAWVVLGPRTAGKSTLMAALFARGLAVLSDDIAVTDGECVYQGPRCIDLRQPVPGFRLDLNASRLGTRWRVPLPCGRPRVPLGGWFFLHWGDEVTVRRVGPGDLIGRLAARRAGPDLASNPEILLALATRSAWDVRRPLDWGQLDATIALLEATAAAAAITPP